MHIFRNRSGTTVRRAVWLPAGIAVLFTAVYLPLASQVVQLASPSPLAAAAIVLKPADAPFPACTPLAFGIPTSLQLDTATTGLTVQNDQITTYIIYGNTASDLQNQIARCAPGAAGNGGAEFTSQTAYNLVWQYSTSGGDNCRLTDIKVGLHIATVLPQWQSTAAATQGLVGRWQQFVSSLTIHEAGHATLDKQYAQQMLTDLTNLGSMSCNGVATTVRAVTSRDVAALNQANNDYDTRTAHGATQGATLPSR